MTAVYLRVKKWKDWQHYKDREPPWVKLHSKLLNDSGFLELHEQEQWQLVRIWMVAARSSRFTLDDKQRIVPVVAYDETTIRRAIGSLKKVPLTKFIASGWLIPVPEKDLVDNPLNAIAALAPRNPGDSTLLDQRIRESEDQKEPDYPAGTSSYETMESLPIENEFLTIKLLELVKRDSDEGTEAVVRSYAKQVAPAALARIIESLGTTKPDNRARYAVASLKKEAREVAA